METRTAEILAQVAFKAAVDAGDDVLTDDGAGKFEGRFLYFINSLTVAVKGASKPAVRAEVARADQHPVETFTREDMTRFDTGEVAERVERNFPGTTVAETREVTLVDWQGAPTGDAAPGWLKTAASADGIYLVQDQTEWAAGTNRPPYKQFVGKDADADTKKAAKPYWQPKARR